MTSRFCTHRLLRSPVFWLLLASATAALIVPAAVVSADPPATATATATATAGAAEQPPMEITKDTTLDPAKTYGRIVIKASNVTIDGRGARVVGATAGKPKDYKGIGIAAKGVSHVTLKNIHAKGWDIGLKIEDGSHWLVENCDFSDNFHDPDFDWGELGRRGGIILERVASQHLPQQQGQPRLDRLSPGRFQRQPAGGQRLLAHVEHLPEPVDRLPQQDSGGTILVMGCGSSPARPTPGIRPAC